MTWFIREKKFCIPVSVLVNIACAMLLTKAWVRRIIAYLLFRWHAHVGAVSYCSYWSQLVKLPWLKFWSNFINVEFVPCEVCLIHIHDYVVPQGPDTEVSLFICFSPFQSVHIICYQRFHNWRSEAYWVARDLSLVITSLCSLTL